jgi:hypothetical protein
MPAGSAVQKLPEGFPAGSTSELATGGSGSTSTCASGDLNQLPGERRVFSRSFSSRPLSP